MNTLIIRPARLSDLSMVEAIEKACFREHLRCSRTALRRSMRSPSQSVWLAEIRNETGRRVVGAMVLRHYRLSIRIFSLAVLPEFQNCGAGGRLVKRAVLQARRFGFRSVILEADSRNPALTRWYKKQGFEAEYLMRDYYGPEQHGVHMRKALSPSRRSLVCEYS